MVDDKKALPLLVVTVTSNDAFDLAVLLTDDQCAEFVDINGLSFKTILERPDLDPVLQRAGDTLPLPKYGIVFAALDEEEMVLELF